MSPVCARRDGSQRYDIHDLFLTNPEPLAPRRRRREIDERIERSGQLLTALDLDQVREAIRALLRTAPRRWR